MKSNNLENYLNTETSELMSNSFKFDRNSMNLTRDRLSKLKLTKIDTDLQRGVRNSSVPMFTSGSDRMGSLMNFGESQRLSDRCVAQIDKISEIAQGAKHKEFKMPKLDFKPRNKSNKI
jgi:hypothetical protein